MGAGDRTVSVTLRAEVAGYVATLRNAARATRDLGDELSTLGKKSPEKLNDVELAAGGIGAALLGVAAVTVKSAADFDKQMSAVKAATHASAGAMEEMRAAALQAGKDTAFSATAAARAEEELAKAGLSTQDVLSGGLRGALDLAAAGSMDVGEAGQVAATALNQFGLAGKDIPHVADLLAAGAGKAQGEVHDMAMALNQSGLVAHQFGLSIEETTGALAAFAASGMIGSDAGTSLKTMLLRLATPTQQAADEMRQLGIHAYDATGKFIGLQALAGQLHSAMGGLTQAERDQAMGLIFGSDAIRAANVLYQQGAAGIKDWTAKVNDAGYASATAADKMDNLAGDLEKLKGTIETLSIQSASGANSGLRVLVQTADHLLGGFLSMPSAINGTIIVLAGMSGAALVAAAGFLKVRQTIADASDAMTSMGPRGEQLAGALGSTAKWGGRVLGVFTALQVTGALMSSVFGSSAASADKLAVSLRKVADAGTASALGGDRKQLDKDIKFVNSQGGLKGAQNAASIESMFGVSGFSWSVSQSLERVKALDAALSQMVQSGNAQQAAQAFAALAAEAQKNGVSAEKFAAMMPQYKAAVDGMTTSASNAADAERAQADATRAMNGTLTDAIDKLGSFSAAFDQLHGKALASLDAQVAAKQAIADLTKAVQEHGASLSMDTEAGRQNLTIVSRGIREAEDAAQKKYEETGSIQSASDMYNQYIGQLRKAMLAAGMNRGAVDELLRTYAQMPPLVQTKVTTPGLSAARNDMWKFKTIIDGVEREVDVYVTTHYKSTGKAPGYAGQYSAPNADGGVYTHAAEGLLRDAAIYTTAYPARYAFAEPQTRGEAFVPRVGDPARSSAIIAEAAGWYGLQVSRPGRYTGDATQHLQIVISSAPGDRLAAAQLAALRVHIQDRYGGDADYALTGRR